MPIRLTDEQRETLRRCLCVCIEQMMDEVHAASWPVGCECTVADWLERGGDGEAIFPGSLRGWRHDIYYLADMLGEWPINYDGCEGWRPITLAPVEECLALRDPTVTPTNRTGAT